MGYYVITPYGVIIKPYTVGERMIQMLAKVLGTRDLDFKSNDGKHICGKQVFVCYPDNSGNSTVHGEMVDKIFISAESGIKIPRFKFGEQYDFQYDVVGFGSRSRSVLREILTKDGKQPEYEQPAMPLF